MTNYQWPWEIRSAVEAFQSDAEWTIVAATVDGPQSFDDIKTILDEQNPQAVERAVSNLTSGGLVQKRSNGDVEDPHDYTVELSEYGQRFVVAMFDTLGDVHAPVDNE